MFAHVYVDSKIERDEPLVYRIPIEHLPKIVRGSLVMVPLRNKIAQGVVFKITKSHNLGQLRSPIKPLISVVTTFPIIQPHQWAITYWLANTYSTHVAQALFSILPEFSKTVFKKAFIIPRTQTVPKRSSSIRHIVGYDFKTRFNWYQKVVSVYQRQQYGILILVPSIEQFPLLRRFFPKAFFFDSGLSQTDKTEVWSKCLSGQFNFIIGTRSALFLPVDSFRLIICDRPWHPGFFEDRQPRYGTWQLAIRLASIMKADLVFGDEVTIPFFKDDKSIRWINQMDKPKVTVIVPWVHQSIIVALIHRLQIDTMKSCLIMVPNKGEVIGYRCLDCQATFATTDLKQCQRCRGTRLKPFGFTTNIIKRELAKRIGNMPFHIVDLDHAYVTNYSFVIATQKIFDYDVRFDYSFVIGIESKVRSPDLLSQELFYRYTKHIINRTNKEVTIFSRDDLTNFLFPLTNDRLAYREITSLRKQLNYYPFGHIIRLTSKIEPSDRLICWLKKAPGVIQILPPHRSFFNRDVWQVAITTTSSFRFSSLRIVSSFTQGIKVDIDPPTML